MTDRARLTKRAVDSAKAPTAGEARLWDSDLAGFCLRVYPTGRRVYAVKYRVAGRQRWLTIGEHGNPWTPDEARERAREILFEASKDRDPALARKALRADVTVAELVETYLTDGRRTKGGKRASSWLQDESNLRRHVVPLIGARRVGSLAKSDIERMVADISAGKTATDEKTKPRGRAIVRGGAGVAARVFSTARAMFAWAIEHGRIKGENPCKGVRLEARPSVERFLTETEAVALFGVLSDLETEGEITGDIADIFRLLLLTGARRNEIAGLRWSEVNLPGALIQLPPERSKAGGKTGSRRIHLGARAADILSRRQRNRGRSAYVFPASKGKSGHTTAAPKAWRDKVQPRAGLQGVRVHDLRHSFASFALADGASLPMIGKALGHASLRATERYAHLADDPLKALSEKVGSRFGEVE